MNNKASQLKNYKGCCFGFFCGFFFFFRITFCFFLVVYNSQKGSHVPLSSAVCLWSMNFINSNACHDVRHLDTPGPRILSPRWAPVVSFNPRSPVANDVQTFILRLRILLGKFAWGIWGIAELTFQTKTGGSRSGWREDERRTFVRARG